MKRREFMMSLCLAGLAGPAALAAEKDAKKRKGKKKAQPGTTQIPEINQAMQQCIDQHEIAGAVTLVLGRDAFLHFSAVGQADLATGAPMKEDTIFWIASMSKLVTASAVMMLSDEGKLSVEDPVAKYLPELAALKTKDGKPGNLTLRHLMTHTSGMGEATPAESKAARKLADLIPCYATKTLGFAPGTQWRYCQSGINSLARIVEVVSGQPFPEFLKARIFDPLGMKDTTFFPTPEQAARVAKAYKLADGKLEEAAVFPDYDYKNPNRAPLGNGGLYSTAMDYAKFCHMLLMEGRFMGKQLLKPETVKLMTSPQTGQIQAGFVPGSAWGLGFSLVREPQGVTAMLSPGTFGHGGAYGTQAWVDPVKERVYIMMVQRANFKNSDASPAREAFQKAAVAVLDHK